MLNNLPCYPVCRSWKPWHYIQSPATRSFTGGVKVHCDSPCKTGRHIDDGDDDYESESDIKNDPRLQVVTSTFPFPSILDLIGGNLTLCTQFQYAYSPYCSLYCSYLFPKMLMGRICLTVKSYTVVIISLILLTSLCDSWMIL